MCLCAGVCVHACAGTHMCVCVCVTVILCAYTCVWMSEWVYDCMDIHQKHIILLSGANQTATMSRYSNNSTADSSTPALWQTLSEANCKQTLPWKGQAEKTVDSDEHRVACSSSVHATAFSFPPLSSPDAPLLKAVHSAFSLSDKMNFSWLKIPCGTSIPMLKKIN